MCVHRIAVKEKLFSEKILLKQHFVFADSEKSNGKTCFFIRKNHFF